MGEAIVFLHGSLCLGPALPSAWVLLIPALIAATFIIFHLRSPLHSGPLPFPPSSFQQNTREALYTASQHLHPTALFPTSIFLSSTSSDAPSPSPPSLPVTARYSTSPLGTALHPDLLRRWPPQILIFSPLAIALPSWTQPQCLPSHQRLRLLEPLHQRYRCYNPPLRWPLPHHLSAMASSPVPPPPNQWHIFPIGLTIQALKSLQIAVAIASISYPPPESLKKRRRVDHRPWMPGPQEQATMQQGSSPLLLPDASSLSSAAAHCRISAIGPSP